MYSDSSVFHCLTVHPPKGDIGQTVPTIQPVLMTLLVMSCDISMCEQQLLSHEVVLEKYSLKFPVKVANTRSGFAKTEPMGKRLRRIECSLDLFATKIPYNRQKNCTVH